VSIIVDETVAELLAATVVAAGRRLELALASPKGRKQADIEVARWFDTYTITDQVPSCLSGWLTYDAQAAFLRENAVQAIVYELLAARLTDAPEAEIERLSKLFNNLRHRKLTEGEASAIFEFLDQQIAGLVGRLSRIDDGLFHRIREDAYLGRIVAAIDRQTAVLSERSDTDRDQDFINHYRQRVIDNHGKLQPPDFERRRLVPISKLYVPPTITQLVQANLTAQLPQVSIWELADRIHRTVLLGDPGGGKTTAAQVILQTYAKETRYPTPFLVVLREYASSEHPERSVLRHIEHNLEVYYQCNPPKGLVESVLLSGSSLVIFDGLDELMEMSQRSRVSTIIENFCAEYPLTRILVTSRTIGYDQARLDDRQFECYQIGGFNSEQVSEYAHKWFACQEGVEIGEAASFLEESAGASDLRSSPLMLALMCILYRGQGSIPRSRSAVYEQCATLLYHRWDASRKIHLELRARNFVEPALRYLAYWLLTRPGAQPVVTEQEFVSETTSYFRTRGEEPTNAEEAAREFIRFCRGRLWVFSEAGTTGRDEPLYTFTHRTFLEYFAAAYLASRYDTPEALSRTLISNIAHGEWDTIAQLAVHIKERTAERGGDRIFQSLLKQGRYRAVGPVGNIIGFIGRCTAFVEPAPATTRGLARKAFTYMLADPSDYQLVSPLAWLMVNVQRDLRPIVRQELEREIAELVNSGEDDLTLRGLRLSLQLHNAPFAISQGNKAWVDWDLGRRFIGELILAAEQQDDIAAVMASWPEYANRICSQRSDVADFIFAEQYSHFLAIYWNSPAEAAVLDALLSTGKAFSPILSHIARILHSGTIPFKVTKSVAAGRFGHELFFKEIASKLATRPAPDDVATVLPIAFAVCVFAETTETRPELRPANDELFGLVVPYLQRRWGLYEQELSPLPVDQEWREAFTAWACREVDFTITI
jgi:NACHT domain